MHASLFKLEVITNVDQKFISLLVRQSQIDKVGHKSAQLIED